MKIKSIAFSLAATFCMSVSIPASASLFTSTDVPKAIPDAATTTSTLIVSNHGTITDVNALLSNITHTWVSDLDIFLISPFGTTVMLTTDNGSAGDNYINTVFDDSAAASITTILAPFTGTFRPEGLLSAFNGQDAFGTWTLRVTDDSVGDTGTINNWGLNITGVAPNVPEPATLALMAIGVAGFRTMRRKQRA
jgi:subtilisin-like proprotein convertase family protein